MPTLRQEVITIRGELTAWRAFGEGWGFGTVRTAVDVVPITGTLSGVRIGSALELTGSWVQHPKYGRQFKAKTCTATVPVSNDGIVKWLAATLPDVGDGRARKLVERFGADLWNVIETAHEALATVEGITPKRAEAIRDAYFKHKADRDNMITLRGWGLTDSQIGKCIEQWGEVEIVVQRVHENPYQLSQHVYGFGFERADKVATKAGIRHDAPERVQAGVAHVLEEASGNGHCFMSGAALQKIAAELLGVDAKLVAVGIRALAVEHRISLRSWRVYPRRLDVAEGACANSIEQLLQRNSYAA
jgi:exodeoxyribonuclease V alpha subunit